MDDTKLGLAGIGHVALKVADIGRSLEFYRDRLGFAEMMRLNQDDGSLWLVYLRITDTQFLELFPGGKGSRAPDREATAINHFCLECDDLDATAAEAQGCRRQAHGRAEDGARRQSSVLDRGSGRQPHRIHADVAEQHAGGGDQAAARRLTFAAQANRQCPMAPGAPNQALRNESCSGHWP